MTKDRDLDPGARGQRDRRAQRDPSVPDHCLRRSAEERAGRLQAGAGGDPGVGTIRNFAYPYGDYDARVIAAEQAAGYRSGRSVEEGYNSKLDLELYDIRVQNMTPDTTLAQYKSWIDYAKAHNYWLVIVYHEVVPDSAPRCQNTDADPDPVPG